MIPGLDLEPVRAGLGVGGRSGEHVKVGPSDLREGRFGRRCPEGRGLDRAACTARTFHVTGSLLYVVASLLRMNCPWVPVSKGLPWWLSGEELAS